MTGALFPTMNHGDTVLLPASTAVSEIRLSPANAFAGYTLNLSGKLQKTTNTGGLVDIGDWCLPGADAGLYECFATLNSGVLDAGTTGSWLALTSTRTWNIQVAPGPGTKDADLTVKIRAVGTTTDITTSHVTLHAESTP